MVRRLIVALVIVFLLTSCNVLAPKENYELIPENFRDFVIEHDDLYDVRIKEFEDEMIYRCFKEDKKYIFLVSTIGYEEDMFVEVILTEDMVTDVRVLYENETPDYGDYVKESWFLERFQLSTNEPLKLVKRKKTHNNEVIAITGATITSKGILIAVNKCINYMEGKKNEKIN